MTSHFEVSSPHDWCGYCSMFCWFAYVVLRLQKKAQVFTRRRFQVNQQK